MTVHEWQRWTASQMCTHMQERTASRSTSLHWSLDPVPTDAVAASSNPAPGVTITVTRDGGVHLQGHQFQADSVHRLHQESLILFHLLNGHVVLHGSAVAVDGVAAVILGPSGAGKSTTAAALVHCGAKLLSDDVVVIVDMAGQLVALPTESHVRLKEALAGKRHSLLDPPTGPANAVDVYAQQSAGEPSELRFVIALTASESATQPQLKQLRGLAALDAVREFGAGQRGLDIQGSAAFLTGLAGVANGTQVWRMERTAKGPTPRTLARDILRIVKGTGGAGDSDSFGT